MKEETEEMPREEEGNVRVSEKVKSDSSECEVSEGALGLLHSPNDGEGVSVGEWRSEGRGGGDYRWTEQFKEVFSLHGVDRCRLTSTRTRTLTFLYFLFLYTLIHSFVTHEYLQQVYIDV